MVALLKEEREGYEMHKDAIEAAFKEGIVSGARQEKMLTVMTMHGLSISIETIALCTRLTVDEVKEILTKNWQ
ncbi:MULTISPECIES: hypothetical protein [Sporosarcina]|uniref:Transposase n=1 Tax=Sporosarcina contaminans TaxID=633403 RepID=A0ABW3U0Q7_9BACL